MRSPSAAWERFGLGKSGLFGAGLTRGASAWARLGADLLDSPARTGHDFLFAPDRGAGGTQWKC